MKKIKCSCGGVVKFPDDQPIICICGETYMRSYKPICEEPVILKTSKSGDQFYTKYNEVK